VGDWEKEVKLTKIYNVMKKQIFIMEDDEFYFEIIKEVLENMSLTFYPSSKNEFEKLRSLICTCTDDFIDSIKEESTKEISKILKDNTDKKTTFLVTCCLGESQDPTLEGLALYKMFTKDCGGKTIIISGTVLSEEIKTIENFCKKEPSCFLFRKSKITLQKNLSKFLMEIRSDISIQPPVKLLKVLRKAERSRLDH